MHPRLDLLLHAQGSETNRVFLLPIIPRGQGFGNDTPEFGGVSLGQHQGPWPKGFVSPVTSGGVKCALPHVHTLAIHYRAATPQMLYRWLVRILGATHEYQAFGLGARGTGEVGEEGEDEGAKTNTLRTKPPAKPMYPHYSSSFPYQLRLRAMPSSNMNTSSVVPQPPLRVQIFLLDPSLRHGYTVRR